MKTLLLFLTLIVVALRLLWCPHVPLTGVVGLYIAVAHIAIGMTMAKWIDDILTNASSLQTRMRAGRAFCLGLWQSFHGFYFWLWFLPFLIEGAAFKWLRVP